MKNENKLSNNTGKKTRKILVAFLLMFSLVLTTGTFAYWATAVEGTSQEAIGTLTVGSGDNVETTFELTNELNSGGYLVPAKQVENSNDGAVGAIDLSFDVQWLEDEATSQIAGTDSVGKIVVKHQVNIYVDGELLDREENAVIYDLVNVLYNEKNATELTLDAAAETFAFQITLDEPADQAEYNLIANAEISITFSYSIDDTAIETTDLK
ncbi:MAG: hypothetical protein JEZ05_09280 [Tenericutes bacterium]|nr:hypothetical protein [Mycoplasmatota bacterium]MBI9010202.1 hypothetical protein [Mycoplasmatota bacterium]